MFEWLTGSSDAKKPTATITDPCDIPNTETQINHRDVLWKSFPPDDLDAIFNGTAGIYVYNIPQKTAGAAQSTSSSPNSVNPRQFAACAPQLPPIAHRRADDEGYDPGWGRNQSTAPTSGYYGLSPGPALSASNRGGQFSVQGLPVAGMHRQAPPTVSIYPVVHPGTTWNYSQSGPFNSNFQPQMYPSVAPQNSIDWQSTVVGISPHQPWQPAQQSSRRSDGPFVMARRGSEDTL